MGLNNFTKLKTLMPTYPVKNLKTEEKKELMDIAEACRKVFTEQFPTVSEALEWV